MICEWCGEEVLPGRNIRSIAVRGSGEPYPVEEPYHRACRIRMITGSLGHHMRRCSCYVRDGTAWEDPPGMSVREAAQRAAEYMTRLSELNEEFERFFKKEQR